MKHDELTPLAGSTRPLGAGSSRPGAGLVLAERQDARRHGEGVEHDRHVRRRRARHRRAADRERGGRATRRSASTSTSAATCSTSERRRLRVVVRRREGRLALRRSAAPSPTHQGAPCWLVTSKDGRYAYTANAGGGTISGFSVGHDGSLTLLDAERDRRGNLGAGSHPLDEAVSRERPLPARARRRDAHGRHVPHRRTTAASPRRRRRRTLPAGDGRARGRLSELFGWREAARARPPAYR